jgi:hypothetical protein
MAAAKKHIKIVKKRTSPSAPVANRNFRPPGIFQSFIIPTWNRRPLFTDDMDCQARSASTATKAIPINASILVGGNLRVLTIECEDGSRAKLPCLRYVTILTSRL